MITAHLFAAIVVICTVWHVRKELRQLISEATPTLIQLAVLVWMLCMMAWPKQTSGLTALVIMVAASQGKKEEAP